MTTEKAESLEAELAELIAANEAATSWGAAVGARLERIKEIRGILRTRERPAPPRCDAQSELTKEDFNHLVELYNRRIEYDVIGIPYEEHRALGRALDILRLALSETKPL